jgi:hypothetical protein
MMPRLQVILTYQDDTDKIVIEHGYMYQEDRDDVKTLLEFVGEKMAARGVK